MSRLTKTSRLIVPFRRSTSSPSALSRAIAIPVCSVGPPEAVGRLYIGRALGAPPPDPRGKMAIQHSVRGSKLNEAPRFAQVNGIRVAYDLTGQGSPLVALHGFPRNRKVWRKLTPLLESRFTVLAPDRRGYGDSDRPTDPSCYDNATMSRDVMDLVEHLEWGPFVVLGHDKGAPT